MASTKTTLASGCSADDLRLRVTSSVGATLGCLVLVSGEYMSCTSIDSATQIGVRSRGSQGGRAVAHLAGAPVTFGLGADFPDTGLNKTVQAGEWDIREAAVDQAFDPGAAGGFNLTRNTEVLIVKAGAWAQTITDPSQGQDGVQVRFVVAATGGSATITYTAGVFGNTTGSDVITLAGLGASVTLRAQNGKWGSIAVGGAIA